MSGGFKVGDLLRIYCKKESNPLWKKGYENYKVLDTFAREGNLVWVIDEAGPVGTSAEGRGQHHDQYLKVRLTNPENLNTKVFAYLDKAEECDIDEGDPITSSGSVLYFNDAIYYLPEDEPDDIIHQFDRLLSWADEGEKNWIVEKYEQTEVNRIIEFYEGFSPPTTGGGRKKRRKRRKTKTKKSKRKRKRSSKKKKSKKK